MFEYKIWSENLQTYTFIWGVSVEDAFNRNPRLNRDNWEVTGWERIED